VEDFRLDARNQLHPPRTQFACQEAVDVERILGILAIDHAQGGERYTVLAQ
jgi:hypothetical protein